MSRDTDCYYCGEADAKIIMCANHDYGLCDNGVCSKCVDFLNRCQSCTEKFCNDCMEEEEGLYCKQCWEGLEE